MCVFCHHSMHKLNIWLQLAGILGGVVMAKFSIRHQLLEVQFSWKKIILVFLFNQFVLRHSKPLQAGFRLCQTGWLMDPRHKIFVIIISTVKGLKTTERIVYCSMKIIHTWYYCIAYRSLNPRFTKQSNLLIHFKVETNWYWKWKWNKLKWMQGF